MNNWWDFGESVGRSGSGLSLGTLECAFCETVGQFKKTNNLQKTNSSSGKTLNYDTVLCENCGNYMFVFWSASRWGGMRGLYAYRTLPFPLGGWEAPEYWPQDVQRFWKQAHKSLDSKTWDAAALMARSALQAVMREQGAKGSNLFEEIKDLQTKGILPPIMKDFADEVREVANDSAHPKPGSTETSSEDAEDIVEFLDILLDYIYNLPKKISDYRARKQQRTP